MKKKHTGLKIFLGMIALLLTAVVVLLIVFARDIATMSSMKKVDEGIYSVHVTSDYKLEKALSAGISSEEELFQWMNHELLFDLAPVQGEIKPFGCASFLVSDPSGNDLLGRNFDYYPTDCCVVYSTPRDGYASIGMADLSFLSLSGNNSVADPDSYVGKALSRLLPYCTVDGVNEKGLAISVLEIDSIGVAQETDAPDIEIILAIRGILDTCADVDEAVSFLGNYDMHTPNGSSYHLFIADSSGRSVVAEWIDNELVVADQEAVTNYIVNDPDYYMRYIGDGRYETLVEILDTSEGILTQEQAFMLLEAVSQRNTQWSCVYDLDGFSLTFCPDKGFEDLHSFTPDDF